MATRWGPRPVQPTTAYGDGIFQGVLKAADLAVTFRSTLTPNMVLYDSNAPPEEQVQNPISALFSRMLQPSVEIHSNFVNETVAPYGIPTRDLSPHFIIASTVILSLAAYGAFELVRPRRR